MRRIAGIIGLVTSHSARPELVLATISCMIAAVMVLALRFTVGLVVLTEVGVTM
jgi:hypothetical protein